LDLAERGMRRGQPIALDRRLFMKFTAFGNCAHATQLERPLAELDAACALYLDVNDPRGVAVMAAHEDPEFFVTALRDVFNAPPFRGLVHKPELDMLGRSYSIGYESDLEDTLLVKPREKLLNPAHRWAVWYPLQRSKKFQTLPADHQRRIL